MPDGGKWNWNRCKYPSSHQQRCRKKLRDCTTFQVERSTEIQVESGRRLVPTKLGIALVHGYRTLDSWLISRSYRPRDGPSCVNELLSLFIEQGESQH